MEALTRFFLYCAAAFCALSLSACSSLLYYPDRKLYVDLHKLNPAPENAAVKLAGGLNVHGWYFHTLASDPPKGLIVFFHGNGQNRSAHFLNLYWLVGKGYDLTVFDYPGYGQTGGSPSPRDTVETAEAVINEAHSHHPNLPLIVYGQSLGGAIATRAVWELRGRIHPQLLIVDSSFLSYRKAAREILAKSIWTWWMQPLTYVLLSDKWAPGSRIADLAGLPIIVIHSKTDQIVPFNLGQDVFSHAREPKEFWVKNTGGHAETYEGPEGPIMKAKLLAALKGLSKSK